MKARALFLAVLAALVALPVLNGLGDEPKKDQRPLSAEEESRVRALMQDKLEHSHKVLEAITQSDFDQIARHANALIVLSKKAEWRVMQTPRYLRYSDDFQRAAEGLVQNAREKNLDAATLSYVEMTLSCTRCHGYVRQVRKVRLDLDSDEFFGGE
jgi:hypothetical protein